MLAYDQVIVANSTTICLKLLATVHVNRSEIWESSVLSCEGQHEMFSLFECTAITYGLCSQDWEQGTVFPQIL